VVTRALERSSVVYTRAHSLIHSGHGIMEQLQIALDAVLQEATSYIDTRAEMQEHYNTETQEHYNA
jgi:hypothetical protein